MIKEIQHNDNLLAIIVSKDFNKPGVHFFTPNNLSQQLAYMHHPKGKTLQPHVHIPITREIAYTQEVLLIKKGKLRVDFYDEEQCYLESYVLIAGDVILLATGGHGFEILEDLEMIEVKQGPYAANRDKTCFKAVSPSNIIIKK